MKAQQADEGENAEATKDVEGNQEQLTLDQTSFATLTRSAQIQMNRLRIA